MRAGLRLRATPLWLMLFVVPAYAQFPGELQAALEKFTADVPAGWAYTLTTERDGRQMTERFDPARPPAEQWSLLLNDGHPPTADELAKYAKFKTGQNRGGPQASFQTEHIDPGSVRLVHADSERAEYSCGFREESANADKMLRHLRLRLTVNKRQPHVEKFVLDLGAAYSPVLGVKMRAMVAEMSFAPPAATRPALPAQSSSRFSGSIFFVPVEENLELTYTDYARSP